MKIPESPPPFDELLAEIDPTSDSFRLIVANSQPLDARGRYLHWDDMRNRKPPEGLSRRQWWFATALARHSLFRNLPFRSSDGQSLKFCNVETIQECVHRIDQQASGSIMADGLETNLRSSERYVVSSLIEEAITSSQLEGASTTRRVAKEMLTSGRDPRDRSELMIVNNFQAMQFAKEISGEDLTPDSVLELHRILTAGTLDSPDAAGRLQTEDDARVSVYWHDDTVLHEPPAAQELPERLKKLCDFANGIDQRGFIHPVVKAIIIHYVVAYDHPFEDGNGRTSRALFYWSLLRDGYWLAEYISISSILNKAPKKYVMSYLYCETDDNDLTYFVIYQLGVVIRAIQSLNDYVVRKNAEAREIERLIHRSAKLNHRQLTVVQSAMRDASLTFTIAAVAGRNRVTEETARHDLLGLADMGLFKKQRVGNKFVFQPVPDLPDRLKSLGAR
jgi:Fic family protein